MDRLGADNSYYFSDDYIQGLVLADDFNAHFTFVEVDGCTAAGAIFVECGPYANYYLSGTVEEYSHCHR